MSSYPNRIACLAAEMPAILDSLNALDRVVGISAYTTYPDEALSIPKVSGFEHGSIERILAVKPDLVIATSTVQTKLAASLAERGATILHVNPHRLDDLYHNIALIGSVIGESQRAEKLVQDLQHQVEAVRQETYALSARPRVYFEEWMDPQIAGIGWVSDLIEMAGGEDVFRTRSIVGRQAKDRVVTEEEWAQAAPDIMLASWCGKPFRPETVLARPMANRVPAVRQGRLYAIDGSILECGPRLLDRLRELARLFREVA